MILSKEDLIEHFKQVEKIITDKQSRYFILIYNSHLKALDKIEDLEKKISK